MDPLQALLDAETHLRDGDLIEAQASLRAYRAWRQGGGFEPKDGDSLARQLSRRLQQLRQKKDEEPKSLNECLSEWQKLREGHDREQGA